jgi:hypothetical protein
VDQDLVVRAQGGDHDAFTARTASSARSSPWRMRRAVLYIQPATASVPVWELVFFGRDLDAAPRAYFDPDAGTVAYGIPLAYLVSGGGPLSVQLTPAIG